MKGADLGQEQRRYLSHRESRCDIGVRRNAAPDAWVMWERRVWRVELKKGEQVRSLLAELSVNIFVFHSHAGCGMLLLKFYKLFRRRRPVGGDRRSVVAGMTAGVLPERASPEPPGM